MNTQILKVSEEAIKLAARIINEGGLVAFKTETVYGLGANAFDEAAVKNIYAVKGRPSDNPLIVHLAKKEDVFKVAQTVGDNARKLMDALMPGPITLVLNKSDIIPDIVSGGRKTIAVRIPSEYWARRLIEVSGKPIAAPSANTSTRPSPTTAMHVKDDLDGKIPLILDGGDCEVGLESTVVDMRGDIPVLLREGGVSSAQIESILGIKPQRNNISKEVVSPGTKYRHYAPKVPLKALNLDQAGLIQSIAQNNAKNNIKTVIIGLESHIANFARLADTVSLGKDSYSAAHNLFKQLRRLENLYDFIIAIRLPDDDQDLSAGFNSRLDKAASGV